MIIIISMFFLRTKFHKNRAHWNSETKSVQVFNFGSRSAGLKIYFIFGTKLSWNEGIDACFNVECVLVGRNFDFLGRYLVLTARYRSLLLVPTFSMNGMNGMEVAAKFSTEHL